MEKIYDETFASNRTLWYGYFDDFEQLNLIELIVNFVKEDVNDSIKNKKSIKTNWIIYCEKTQKDALTEAIRSSIMICSDHEKFSVHCNMSDFEFVTKYEALCLLKETLAEKLNQE